MGVLIDTNILIKYEKGQIDLERVISGRERQEFFISVITASELLHGVWRADELSIRARRHSFVESILNNFPILPIDLSVARTHSQLWAELRRKGEMIGIHDSWIAATCITKGAQLITKNSKEFRRVPGLVIESW